MYKHWPKRFCAFTIFVPRCGDSFLLWVIKWAYLLPHSVTLCKFVPELHIQEPPQFDTRCKNLCVVSVQNIFKNDRSVFALGLIFWRHPRRFPSYSYYCVVSDQVFKACFHHNIGLLCTDNAYSLVQHGKVYVVGCLIMQFVMFSFWLVAELSSPKPFP